MKCILAIGALASFANAHTLISHFHVNGKADSSCVRIAQNTNPLIDLSSPNMACNAVKGNAKSKCKVKGGDKVAFEYRTDPGIPAATYPKNDEGEDVGVIDASHMGPCAVYAKKVSDSLTAQGPGNGWFKISEDGLDGQGVFCTTRLRKTNAPLPATIPNSLEPGDYLLRAEILTLNDAGPKSLGGKEQPQFYTGCVQVTVEGTDGTAKPETVSIPGYVNLQTPGLIFDIWNSKTFKDYPMPGPKPLAAGSNIPKATVKKPVATQDGRAKTSTVDSSSEEPLAGPNDTPSFSNPENEAPRTASDFANPESSSPATPATTSAPSAPSLTSIETFPSTTSFVTSNITPVIDTSSRPATLVTKTTATGSGATAPSPSSTGPSSPGNGNDSDHDDDDDDDDDDEHEGGQGWGHQRGEKKCHGWWRWWCRKSGNKRLRLHGWWQY